MTISSSDRVAGPFTGNSVTTIFPFNYKVFVAADVVALISDGQVETPLTLGADFTVSLNADQNANPGGAVTYPIAGAPLTAAYTLTLSSDLSELQPVSLTNQGGFYPKVIENAFDRCVILLQQLRSSVNRTLRFPLSDSGVSTELPPQAARANNLLGFDSLGRPMAVIPSSQSAIALQTSLAASGGAGMVGFLQAGAGTVARTVQGKLRDSIPSILDFGGVSGTGDNTAAFTAAEGSAFATIYLPPGDWLTSSAVLSKVYTGQGKAVVSTARQASQFVTVNTLPTPGSVSFLFDGDQRNIQSEHFKLPSTLKVWNMTNQYFNNELSPHLFSVEAFTGYSGMSTKVNGTSPVGQTGLIVRNTAGITSGMQLLVGDGTARREILTVAVVASGVLLAMTSNLLYTHTAAQADVVAKGNRTHFEGYRTHMDGTGGGDYYAYTGRISLGNGGLAANPDQMHFSQAATAGLIDGDATAAASGIYLQCSEFSILGSNYLGDHDIAAIGDVRSYQRNNDTGAKGVVWIGNLQKSEGTKYCNAAYSVLGKWLGGIDLINADFGTNKAAIKLAPNQRIFFNGASAADSEGYNLWGADAGTTYMAYNSAFTQLEFTVGGVTSVAISSTKLTTAANVNIVSGGAVAIGTNKFLYLGGDGSNTYFTFNGTHVYLVTNGGTPQQIGL